MPSRRSCAAALDCAADHATVPGMGAEIGASTVATGLSEDLLRGELEVNSIALGRNARDCAGMAQYPWIAPRKSPAIAHP